MRGRIQYDNQKATEGVMTEEEWRNNLVRTSMQREKRKKEKEQRGRSLLSKLKNNKLKTEEDLMMLLDILVTGLLIGFLITVGFCLACRKQIRQPVFDADSHLMQSFIDNSTRCHSDMQPLKDEYDVEDDEEEKQPHKRTRVKQLTLEEKINYNNVELEMSQKLKQMGC